MIKNHVLTIIITFNYLSRSVHTSALFASAQLAGIISKPVISYAFLFSANRTTVRLPIISIIYRFIQTLVNLVNWPHRSKGHFCLFCSNEAAREAGGAPAPVLAPYESKWVKIFNLFLVLKPSCVHALAVIELFHTRR